MYPQSWSSVSGMNYYKQTIEVTGEAAVAAVPDKAAVVLGAITENRNLSAAQKENAAAVAKIVTALTKLSIPNDQIQTVNYRIDILYDYVDGRQSLRGYQVTHLLQVNISKADQAGPVIDTAVANGANSVSNVEFSVAHPEIHYNRALTLAISNAESKAGAIARDFGVTLIKQPIMVQEESRVPEARPYQAALAAASGGTPIQPGQTKITASVRVVFSYY